MSIKFTTSPGWGEHTWQIRRSVENPRFMANVYRVTNGEYRIVIQRRDLKGTFSNIVREDVYSASQREAISIAKESISIWES